MGIGLRLAAVIGLAAVSAGVKWLTAAGTPLSQIIFCRNIFAFIPILIMVKTTVGFGALRTRRPLRHLTRSAMGLHARLNSSREASNTAKASRARATSANFAT